MPVLLCLRSFLIAMIVRTYLTVLKLLAIAIAIPLSVQGFLDLRDELIFQDR